MIIETNALTKNYGKKIALREVNFTIGRGVFGLLGPNGAGKSTLMKILSCLLKPTSGTARVYEHDTVKDPSEVRKLIGVIPQEYNLYNRLNPTEFLEYMLLLSGKDLNKKHIEEMLERVNLSSVKKQKIGSFSGGMKQRLVVAQALVHNPQVILADEPTAGLDPEERVRFRNLFSEIGLEKTVLLSTHITEDITSSTKNLFVLNQGSLVFSGQVQDFVHKAEGNIWTTVVKNQAWEAFKGENLIISFMILPESNDIEVRYVPGKRTPAEGSHAINPTLEDAYMLTIHQNDWKEAS
ncbi:MAG: ABC transporter ATP-binding protein [Chloroflexi bacterium]|nr:ABC transporter ATP-binding protein [Chloroflexota bacterium]